MPYDIFISYSRRDNEQGRITQLIERIKVDFARFAKRELEPFFDQSEIHGMQDWRQRILQGLRESRLLLACLSPTYLQSDYCEWELVEYLKYEIGHLHGFNGVAPIYFVQVPGWDAPDFDQKCAAWVSELRRRQNIDLRPWHDQGEEALRESAVQERMGKLNRQIAQTIMRGERAEKSLGNVDAHNPHFIGRTANLRMLRDNFVKPGHIGVVTAVNGVGGLGKTALAIEYAHAFADEYGGGRWQVRCAGKDDLRLALAELATPIGFEFTDDEKKNADLQFERTRRELKKLADAREPHRCLLLLDNVDRPGLLDPAQVARLNGGDWLHVLATTRLGENELHGAHRDRSFLAINELPPDDALALIESYQRDGRFRSEAERDAAREIVRLLGSFTLAVESAAVYLGQFANDVTCAAFLARLKKEGLEGLDTAAGQSSEGVLHGEKRLSATLQPTLERLGAPEKLALEFAALLPPDQVPLPWLRALVAKTFPEMERDADPGYPDPWKNVLRRLFSLRLLQLTNVIDANGQPLTVRMHRLVGELLHKNTGLDQDQKRDELSAHVEVRCDELEHTWHQSLWEIPPLIAYTREILERRDAKAPVVVRSLCQWLPRFDDGLDSVAILRTCLAQLEENPSKDSSDLPVILSNLGWALDALGKYQEAEPFLRRALEIDERERPEGKHALSVRCNNLQGCLRAQGRLSEAEPFCRRALELAEQALGKEHPDTLTCLSWLADLLKEKGDYAEAERLLRRWAEMTERIHNPEHPEVARSLIVLSNFLRETNRLTEGELLIRRALTIYEKTFGPENFGVANALGALASVLEGTNRLAEAEPLYRRALAIDEKTFGPENPHVATRLNNLAGLLYATNRLGEGEPLLRRSLMIWEKNLGPENPRVAKNLNNLSVFLQAMNRLAEAEPLVRRALVIGEKSFGPEHPEVASFLNTLAGLLYSTNRLDEAETLYRRALAIDEKSLGHEHPHVARDISKLAQLLLACKRPAEAEPLMRRALKIRERALVSDHPDALKSMDALAGLLEETGRFEEAVPLRQHILATQERTLGPEHPDTLRSWTNYCHSSRKQGRAGFAEPIDRKVVATTTKLLGDIHPHAIHRRNNLVLTLIMLGKLEEARQILAANWRLNAPPHANTTPRIAFLRHLIALLESQPDTPFLGQLKTLLTGPELPVASEVAVPWDIAYFIEFLKPKLSEHNAEFLTALVAALNDRAKVSALDPFAEWHTQPPLPLDIPWPDPETA